MTDQPTKWILDTKSEITYLWSDPNVNWIGFHGPDHKANAKLFLRAQHMDELVEAATKLLPLAMQGHRNIVVWDSDTSDVAIQYRQNLAILAKIKGKQS